jgi:hypothetical protein
VNGKPKTAIKVTDKISGLEMFQFLSGKAKADYKFIGNFDPFINGATGHEKIKPIKVKKTQACWVNGIISPQTGQLSGFYSPESIEEKSVRVEFDITESQVMNLLTDNGASPQPDPVPDYDGYELQVCLNVHLSEKLPPIVSGFNGDQDSPDVLPYNTGGTASDPKNEFTFINCYNRCIRYYEVREAGYPAIVGGENPNPHLYHDNKVIHFDNVAYAQTKNYSVRNPSQNGVIDHIEGLREAVIAAIEGGSVPDTCDDCCETKQDINELCSIVPIDNTSSSVNYAGWGGYEQGWCSWEHLEAQIQNCEQYKEAFAPSSVIIGGINLPDDIDADSCSVKLKSERFKYYYMTNTDGTTLEATKDTCNKSPDCSSSSKKANPPTCTLESSIVGWHGDFSLEAETPNSAVNPADKFKVGSDNSYVSHDLVSSVNLKVPSKQKGVDFAVFYGGHKYIEKSWQKVGFEHKDGHFSGWEASKFNTILVKSKKAVTVTMVGTDIGESALSGIKLPKNLNIGWGFNNKEVTSGPLGVDSPVFTLGNDSQGSSGGEFLKAISQTECIFSNASTSSAVFERLLSIIGIQEDSSGVTFKSDSQVNLIWERNGIPVLTSVGVSGNNITGSLPNGPPLEIKCRFYIAEPLEAKKCGEISDPQPIMIELELNDESLMSALALEAKTLVAGVLNNPPWKDLTDINPVDPGGFGSPEISASEPISNMFIYDEKVYTITEEPEPLRTRVESENGVAVNYSTNVGPKDFVFRVNDNSGGSHLVIDPCVNMGRVRITKSSAAGNFIVVKAESTKLTRDQLLTSTYAIINQNFQSNPSKWWKDFLKHISNYYQYENDNYSRWIYGFEFLENIFEFGPSTHKFSAQLPYTLKIEQQAIFQDPCTNRHHGEQKWYNSKGKETDEDFILKSE